MRIRTLERVALAALVAFAAGTTTLASPGTDGGVSGGRSGGHQLSRAERKARRLQTKQQTLAAEQPQSVELSIPYFPADLNSMKVITGELLDGKLEYLKAADDDKSVTFRSGYGDLPGQTHLIETVLSAKTDTLLPIAIALSLEARSSENGRVILHLRNWETGEFEEVARTAIGPRNSRFFIDGISASRYLGENGEIQVSLQQVVTIPAFSKTFQMNIDWLEIGVF